jgi:hypothetical protein
VARQQAAMTFIGQFAHSAIKAEVSDKIGYFASPHVNPDKPKEVWIVAKASEHKVRLPPYSFFT